MASTRAGTMRSLVKTSEPRKRLVNKYNNDHFEVEDEVTESQYWGSFIFLLFSFIFIFIFEHFL